MVVVVKEEVMDDRVGRGATREARAGYMMLAGCGAGWLWFRSGPGWFRL